jgi:hypothetical protein
VNPAIVRVYLSSPVFSPPDVAPSGRRRVVVYCTGSTSGREFTAWNGLTFNFVIILQAHDVAIGTLTFNHAGTYIASACQSGIVKYLKTSMNNLTAWRAQRGQFSRQITHDLPLPVMTLWWGSGLWRRVERSASLPATDGTSNASSGTQKWASLSRAARTI